MTFCSSEDTAVSDVDQLRAEILEKFSDIIKAGDNILIQVLNYYISILFTLMHKHKIMVLLVEEMC